ncbi:MAG TPA: hypothetical protein VGH73_12290 [Thermoanaerobaculia bacterium]|jgi:hypothetical protein
MPKAHLSIAILLALAAPAAFAAHRTTTASFVPPAETGTIFTVINYDHAFGRTQGTVVNVDWGAASRRITVAPPYRTCAETPAAGIVLKLRHPRPDSVPLTITTTGTIVRGPYQGDPPLELLSACYHLAS